MGIAIALILSMLSTGEMKLNANVYADTAIITEITDDMVEVTMSNGNVFSFKGSEDYEKGDLVSLLMYDNATETVNDDEILDAKYAGSCGQLLREYERR